MNIACPECSTFYRVNPDRVPETGISARCRECGSIFRVDPDWAPMAPGEHVTATAVPAAGANGPDGGTSQPVSEPGDPELAGGEVRSGGGGGDEGPEAGSPVFGPQDPDTRARRLARALVSDMKVYNLEKWQAATESGTLRQEFRDEILKSWDEYVEQVGKEMAKGTPYFRNALNEILARGEAVF